MTGGTKEFLRADSPLRALQEESGGNVAALVDVLRFINADTFPRRRGESRPVATGWTEDRRLVPFHIRVTFRNSRSLSGPLPKWIDLGFQRGRSF